MRRYAGNLAERREDISNAEQDVLGQWLAATIDEGGWPYLCGACDYNTSDVLWLADGLTRTIQVPLSTECTPINERIAIVETVESLLLQRSLIRYAADLVQRLKELHNVMGSDGRLVASLYLWHGCICAAKSMRPKYNTPGGRQRAYTVAQRWRGWAQLREDIKQAEVYGNHWIQHGADIAEEFERQRGNTIVTAWLQDTAARDAALANAEVGAEVCQCREALHLTIDSLATRARVSPAYLQRLEAGDANPTLGQIGRIAGALGACIEIDMIPNKRGER